jgi:hypothetical protein
MIKTIPGKRCIVPCDLKGLENMGVLLFLSSTDLVAMQQS